jgi:hypothetical protein
MVYGTENEQPTTKKPGSLFRLWCGHSASSCWSDCGSGSAGECSSWRHWAFGQVSTTSNAEIKVVSPTERSGGCEPAKNAGEAGGVTPVFAGVFTAEHGPSAYVGGSACPATRSVVPA